MDAVALSQDVLESVRGESDLKSFAKHYVEHGRRLLFEKHRAGAGGFEIALAGATMMDHLIRYLFNQISTESQGAPAGRQSRLTVLAQGGYGRGELCPHSDIDLLFLYSWRLSDAARAVTEKLLYTLWDSGLQVGHATRNIKDCAQLAESDMKVRTSLLDTRFLCGDFKLYGEFQKSVYSRLVRRGINHFVKEKLAESRARHDEYGGSVYLLEPDVKEGEGGLRDAQTATWIARAKLKGKSLDALASTGMVAAEDLVQFKSSQDFLLRVRNELHFATGKHQDQLTFEQQEKVSDALGFQGEGTLRAVEVFMRSYYLHAANISRLSSLIVHRLTECKRPMFPTKFVFGRKVRDGVRLSQGHLSITNAAILDADSGNLIRVFADMQRYGCELSHETRELLRQRASLIDEAFRRSAAANLPFFAILKGRDSVYETLLEMHRAGVLGEFIPEFGHLLCMVLHDAYHVYTVDQHSLRLVKETERLKAGEYAESLPLLTQLVREAEKIELLYLGMMFHDIGKGFGGGHSEVGARLVRAIARRMRLNADDGAMVEFLVRHHLLMTHTAFRRDLEDDKTIFDFAKTMGSVKNLKMLFLLTFADVKAVGPEVWNAWKASLLGELYVKALNILEEAEKGEFQPEDLRAILRRIQTRVRRELGKNHLADAVERFIEIMPDRYFLVTNESDIPAHFDLLKGFDGDGAACAVEHFPERDCSSLVVCTRDRPGVFASITGVLSALGFDILNARIFTTKDGRALDVFRIAHRGKSEVVMSERRWARFRTTLNGVLKGSVDVVALVDSAKPTLLMQKRVPRVSTVVQIDNLASDHFTIVEIFTDDRMGILFSITHALHNLGLSIHLAKISTNVDQVADVFYVTDDQGNKLASGERAEAVRAGLHQMLKPDNDGISQSIH